VFQFHFLLAEFTVLDNILLPMRRVGILAEATARERADDLLRQFDLRDQGRKHPHQLSGGQRHDLTFAAADRYIGIVDGRIDPDWRA
jgi:lipoprotein-releasing system ATP-binding protein